MHDASVSVALLPADVADEAVDAAEDHRHEDDYARHQDLDDGLGGGRGEGSGGKTKDHFCIMLIAFPADIIGTNNEVNVGQTMYNLSS